MVLLSFWICRSSMPDVHLFMTVFFIYEQAFELINIINLKFRPRNRVIHCHSGKFKCTISLNIQYIQPYLTHVTDCIVHVTGRTDRVVSIVEHGNPDSLTFWDQDQKMIWDVRSHIEHPTCGLEKFLKEAPSLFSRWIQYLIFVLMLEVHHKNHKKI